MPKTFVYKWRLNHIFLLARIPANFRQSSFANHDEPNAEYQAEGDVEPRAEHEQCVIQYAVTFIVRMITS